jgi:sarcosine oxidase
VRAERGLVRPEETVRQNLNQAAKHRTDLHFEEPVDSWSVDGADGRVTVKTAVDTYEAERMVLCSGAWAPEILAELRLPLKITRQVMFWFDPIGGVEPFLPERCPVYIWQPDARRPFYGFPSMDGRNGGVKNGDSRQPRSLHTGDHRPTDRHGKDLHVHHDARRTFCDRDAPELFFHHDCGVIFGPGFKFASVVGEILADLATTGTTRHNIELFSPARFKRVAV